MHGLPVSVLFVLCYCGYHYQSSRFATVVIIILVIIIFGGVVFIVVAALLIGLISVTYFPSIPRRPILHHYFGSLIHLLSIFFFTNSNSFHYSLPDTFCPTVLKFIRIISNILYFSYFFMFQFCSDILSLCPP